MFSSGFFGAHQRSMVREHSRASRSRGSRDSRKGGKRPLRSSKDVRDGAQVRNKSEPVVDRLLPTHRGKTARTKSVYASPSSTSRGEHVAPGHSQSVRKTRGVSKRHDGEVRVNHDELLSSIEDTLAVMHARAASSPDVGPHREDNDATNLDGLVGVTSGNTHTNLDASPVWLDPLLGVGSAGGGEGGGVSERSNDKVRKVLSLGSSSDRAGASSVLNSGAADGLAVKYDGIDPNGGEPRKTAVSPLASDPTDGAMLETAGNQAIGTVVNASISGKQLRNDATVPNIKAEKKGGHKSPNKNGSNASGEGVGRNSVTHPELGHAMSQLRKHQYEYYAVADVKHWGVHSSLELVESWHPVCVKGFNDLHEAREWLEEQDAPPNEDDVAQVSTSSHSTAVFTAHEVDTRNLPGGGTASASSEGTDVAEFIPRSGSDGSGRATSAGGEGDKNTLFGYGFKQVGVQERRRQHEHALAALQPYLELSSKNVVDLTGEDDAQIKQVIPKKKRKQVEHAHVVPVPRRTSSPTGWLRKVKKEPATKHDHVKPGRLRKVKKETTAEHDSVKPGISRGDGKLRVERSGNVTKSKGTSGARLRSGKLTLGASTTLGSEPDAVLKRIVAERNDELARAVIKARDEEAEIEAMLSRVYAHQPRGDQSYRRRLRSAIYFDDSGSEGPPTGVLVGEDTSDSNHSEVGEGWDHEPRHNKKDMMHILHERMNQTLEENRHLRQQVTQMMRFMETHGQSSKPRVDHSSAYEADLSGDRLTSGGASSAFERVIGHAQRSPVGQASSVSKDTGSAASAASGAGYADEGSPAQPPRVKTPSTIASSASSALASRHEREALESSKPTGEHTGAATNGVKPDDNAVDSKIEEGADEAQTSNNSKGDEEKEPDPGPPALPEGALGLQQLLMGGTDVKKNEMDILYSASEKAILEWRSKRKRYLKKIREHNAGHAIKLEARPVKDFVDELIWNAISKTKLLPQHRTKQGEDANHIQ